MPKNASPRESSRKERSALRKCRLHFLCLPGDNGDKLDVFPRIVRTRRHTIRNPERITKTEKAKRAPAKAIGKGKSVGEYLHIPRAPGTCIRKSDRFGKTSAVGDGR